jgi:methyl-accepting chemotaxis protein
MEVVGDAVTQVRASSDSIGTARREFAIRPPERERPHGHTATNPQDATSSMPQRTGVAQRAADAACQAKQLAGSAAEVAYRGAAVITDVASTAVAFEEDREHARQVGMDGVVAKPFSSRCLCEVLATWTARRNRRTVS